MSLRWVECAGCRRTFSPPEWSEHRRQYPIAHWGTFIREAPDGPRLRVLAYYGPTILTLEEANPDGASHDPGGAGADQRTG